MTPTQYLLMEVLVARYRLGESIWTFPKRYSKALDGLVEDRLVGYKSGIVYNTVMVWITPRGKDLFMADDYRPGTWGTR